MKTILPIDLGFIGTSALPLWVFLFIRPLSSVLRPFHASRANRVCERLLVRFQPFGLSQNHLEEFQAR